MSKAFVKEDSTSEGDDDGQEASGLQLPAGTKNYITPAGAERLRAEHKHLLDVERPEVVRVVSWAAGNGDRSENGDYIYGKRRLREIDRRLRFLSKRMANMEIVDPAKQSASRVLFGAQVTVEDEAGAQKTYRIVGVDEVNPSTGDISWISPMARALLNHVVGDVVTVKSPAGERDYEIIAIEYG